ncbi:hypothetical protein ACFQZZ_25305 [Nocardia sp. GCM10030253]|uniref:hypothetical protein n=1 Tax=Nocardia sp. GCM10030253 TaxID=3273404 RepID=UPI00363AFBFA
MARFEIDAVDGASPLSIVGIACQIGAFPDVAAFEQAVYASEASVDSAGEFDRDAMLRVAGSAMRDAGFDRNAGHRIAVLIAHDGNEDRQGNDVGDLVVDHICSQWNLTGPSRTFVADSVGALAAATQLLLDKTIEAVLVGAQSLATGAVAVVVARAAADVPARREYARIEAVSIRTSAASKAQASFSASADLMREAAEAALTRAGITPADVGFLETNAGIADQDHTEILALASVYAAVRASADSCALGSVRSVVGDTRNLSALAGVIKAALCLYHRYIPGSPGSEAGRPEDLDSSAFYAPTRSRPWLRESTACPRYAAVNVIGSGGALGHIVLSGPPLAEADRPIAWYDGGGHLILPVGGNDLSGMLAGLTRWRSVLETQTDIRAVVQAALDELGDGRLRVVLVAAHREALLGELDRAVRDLPQAWERGEWSTPAGSYFTARPIGATGKVAFVYPGAFNSYLGLGQDLFRLFPALLDMLEGEVARPAELFGARALYPCGRATFTRRELMVREAALLENVPAMLATSTAFAVLSTALLTRLLGLRADGAFGYSLGEASMMFATGVWRQNASAAANSSDIPLFRERLCGPKRTVRELWNVPESVPDDEVWATYLLLADEALVRQALTRFDRVYLTHVNTPNEVVIGGDPEQCRLLIDAVGSQSVRGPANHVLHCPVIESELDELTALHRYPTAAPPGIELLSARKYDRIEALDSDMIAHDIAQSLAATVDFPRLVRAAYDRGYRYFIEVGPGSTCTRWIKETLGADDHVAVAIDRRGASTSTVLSQALARLISHGLVVDLNTLTGPLVLPDAGPAAPVADPGMPPTMPTTTADLITFEGEPFGYPPAYLPPAPEPPAARPQTLPTVATRRPPAISHNRANGYIRELREQVFAAHAMAMDAQRAMQDRHLARLELQVSGGSSQTAGEAVRDASRPKAPGTIWDEEDVLEFTTGSVAAALGPAFASVDGYARRVRLPEPPYLFVTRVTELDAQTGRFESSSIRAEYDVPVDAWYTVDGQVPPAVALEAAGQGKLLLLAYLGIDFRNQGRRVYRMLGGTFAFQGALPREGQTLRYDVSIDRFVWNGDTPLVFFHCEGRADGELFLEMKNACAGFFTEAELQAPIGVVTSDAQRGRRAEVVPSSFKPLAYTAKQLLGPADLELLAAGRVAEVFGAQYEQDGCNPSLRLSGARLRMIDEVTAIERCGGPRGLGRLTAVKHLDPDDWYFRCHFRGDPVLPGSLVGEGGVQLMQVFALYLGLHLCLPDASFQPVTGLDTQAKVRGQIAPGCRSLTYEVEVTDVRLLPRPTVIADIVVYAGNRPVVSVHNCGIELREKPGTPYRPESGGIPAAFLGRKNRLGERALVNELHIAHLAKGDLATAMGPEFEIYRTSRAPHMPHGDLQFIDRIMTLDGARGQLSTESTMSSEYDSPADAWYYRENSFPFMPNFAYMETGLQGTLLLGFYLGATLIYPNEQFSVRNLDGRATVVKDVDLRGKLVRIDSRLLSTRALPGVVLQTFAFELSADGEVFYAGDSLFGFFNERALANQAGLDNGAHSISWLDRQDSAPVGVQRIDLRTDPSAFEGDGAHLKLAQGQLRLVDRADVVPGGGQFQAGYVRGYRQVRPDDWYFGYHFHRDPVMPGSLGVEAVIQALQLYILRTGLAEGITRPRFAPPRGVQMSWRYRGQILPTDRDMEFEAHIKEVRRDGDQLVVIADANVWRDGLRIYELQDVAVEVRSAVNEGDL